MSGKNAYGKILVVDNNDLDLGKLCGILKKDSYSISFSSSGNVALDLLRRNEYDLVLLDIKMPRPDGFEVCEKMKKNSKNKDTPVIFISQSNADKSVEKGFTIGGRDYVFKSSPCLETELLARVRTHLELHSARKKLQQANNELTSKNNELYFTNKELRKIDYQKREFLGIAAYLLRKRLVGVMGYTELLKINPLLDQALKTSKNIDKIEASSEKMLQTIEELLEKAVKESINRTLNKTRADVGLLAGVVIEHNMLDLEKKNQILVTTIEEECMVYGDEIILQDVIDEVLNNAIKYSPNGKSIYLKVSKNMCFVSIEVKDEGPGFSEEDKDKLFNKFQPLSAQPTGGERRTGFGLAYTKDYVDLHGGRIDLESELGKGAIFTILLPIYKEIKPEGRGSMPIQ